MIEEELRLLRAEVESLRAGEEEGYDPTVWPTPGQFLKFLHIQDPARRLAIVESVLAAARRDHHRAMHPDNRARRILCGHRWEEAGRGYECAEPVDEDGGHDGDHYAYVREAS